MSVIPDSSVIAANLISSISSSTKKSREEVESNLLSNALRNKDVQDCIANAVIVSAQNSEKASKRVPVRIFQKLTSSEQSILQDSFSCFNLDFKESFDSSPHGFARAHRELERRYIMHQLRITPQSVPVNGYDVVLKDVGGNPITHLNRESIHVHTCYPNLSDADDFRHSNYLQELRNMKVESMSRQQKKCYRMHINGDRRVICHDAAQRCDVTSQNVLFLHSVYDITTDELAMIMARADALTGMGCFIFFPEILITQSGEIPHLKCHYAKFKRNKRLMIRFWFENDTQNAYEHDYNTYISMLSSTRVSCYYQGREHHYHVKPLEIKNNVMFFKIQKSICGNIPTSFSTIVYSLNSLRDRLVLYYYSWDSMVAGRKNNLVPVRVIVPYKMYENLYSYALGLPEGKLTIKNLMTAGFTFNSREIINGVSVVDHERIPSEDVQKLVHAIFLFVYISQYEASQTTSYLINQEVKIRAFCKKGYFTRFLHNRLKSIGKIFSGSSDSHQLLERVALDDIKNCSTTQSYMGKFEKFLDYIESLANPEKEYKTFISDYMCRFITVEEEINNIVCAREKRDRGFHTVTFSDSITPEMIKEAMFNEIPVEDTKVYSSEDFVAHTCDTTILKEKPNYSDGDCIYESLRDHQLTTESITAIRKRLSNSIFIHSVKDNESLRKNLVALKSPENYGDDKNFLLIALEFQITVCIHTGNLCRRFGAGRCYHFMIRNQHCTALLPDYQLENTTVIILPVIEDSPPSAVGFETDFRTYQTIDDMYTREKDTQVSTRQYKLKLNVAMRTVDPFCHLNNGNYSHHDCLVINEIFVRYPQLSPDDLECSFLATSGGTLEWYADCVPGRRYIFSTNDESPVVDYSMFVNLPGNWNRDRTHILSLRNSVNEYNKEPVDLFISTLRPSIFLPNALTNEEKVRESHFNFSHYSLLCASILRVGGNAVFLTNIIESEYTTRTLFCLRGMFETVYLVKPHTSHPTSVEYAVVCLNRTVDMYYDGMVSEILLGEEICEIPSLFVTRIEEMYTIIANDLINSNRVCCRHISQAKTKHERAIELDSFVQESYEKLLFKHRNVNNSMVAGALTDVVRRGVSIAAEFFGMGVNVGTFGDGMFCPEVEEPEYTYDDCSYDSFETALDNALLDSPIINVREFRDKLAPTAPPIEEVVDLPVPDRTYTPLPQPSKKKKFSGGAVVKKLRKSFRKKQKEQVSEKTMIEDPSTGITYFEYHPVIVADSDLQPRESIVLKNLPKKSTCEIEPVSVEKPIRNCYAAMKEYLGYLDAVYKAEGKNIVLFFERVLKTKSNLTTAIQNYAGGHGLFCPSRNSFYIYPKEYSTSITYNKYYNSKFELKSFLEVSNESEVFHHNEVDFVIVNDYCLHGFEKEEYEQLSPHLEPNYSLPEDCSVVQAGPGTGKTYYIVKNHNLCISNDPSTVLLATREGCADFRDRVIKSNPDVTRDKARQYYRTLASYLLNPSKNRNTRTLFIDEALMSHPGALFFAVKLSGALRIRFLGDTLQIPFVNQMPDYRCSNLCLTDFVKIDEVLETSYRCPVDVAYRLNPEYLKCNQNHGIQKGLKSANHRYNTAHYVKIENLNQVPVKKEPGYKYLTFTQSEKDQVACLGVDVSTVHEYQGKESDNIIVVRLNSQKQTEIFLQFSYALVALTRHRVTCVYYTKVTGDALSKMIRVDKVRISEYATAGQMKDVVAMAPTGVYHPFPVVSVIPNTTYATFEQRSGRLSHSSISELHFVPRYGRYAFNPPYLPSYCVGCVTFIRRDKLIICLESSDNHNQSPSAKYLTHVIRKYSVKIPSTVGISAGIFRYIDTGILSQLLYKNFKSHIIVFDTSFVDQIDPQVFELLNINAIIEIPNSKVTNEIEYVPNSPLVGSLLERPFCISLAQSLIDSVFLETAYIDQTLDAWMVHTNDLILHSGEYSFNLIKGVYSHSTYDGMTPVLKTPMYQLRGVTSREVRLALEKRNLAVPKLSGTVDYQETSHKMLESMLEQCFDFSKLQVYNKEVITVSATDIHEWLRGQETFVTQQIVPEFSIFQSAVNEYNYSIKRNPKPNLTVDATSTYAALQTIVYHEKPINAMFCVQFRKIKERITKCLKNYVYLYCDMSPSEFESVLTENVDRIIAVFSGDDSFLCDGENNMEIDISKYDKSQGLLALEFDCLVLSYFGMPPYFVELWRNGHMLTKIIDRSSGLRCLIPFQRKSGDASTFILNTVFLMGVISHEIPIGNLDMIDLNNYRNIDVFALLFNLEVKMFSYKFPYFCSKFLLKIRNRWIFCPDPLKLFVKLGRSDLVNEKHVEFYRVSFADNVQCYSDPEVCSAVSFAMRERYCLKNDISFLLGSLPSLAKPSEFSKLFFIKEGSKIDHARYQFTNKD
ncbi:RNA-dependent RNA polymerase [Astegopteryx formosana nege-like virus 1]|nr:RNA-dependent RNA polymerase [Astegopteryx formosana nege-like virus 1]